MLRPGEVIGGRFEIEHLAGEGGMATVFRARDLAAGEHVAVKVLQGVSPDHARRFSREAKVLAQLRHPAIVRHVADGLTEAGAPWLAMEWLEGEDLHARLARGGLTIADSIALARRVAEAMQDAHALGIVHRDIKPSNLFLPGGDTRRVKVLDFGIARVARATNATVTGAMLGTPGYMAPEQARGAEHIDARADVFALGCVLFECITGEAAFSAEHIVALMAKILFAEPPQLAQVRDDVPPALDALVARMLCKEPNGRLADASAVISAIDALEHHEGEARPASLRGPSLTTGERRLVSVIIGKTDRDAAYFGETATNDAFAARLSLLRALARRFDAHLEMLPDGTVLAVVGTRGGAAEQAVRAARCALSLRSELLDTPLAIATGRALFEGPVPTGDAIDRAVALVRARGAPTSIVVDEVTERLIEARFDVIDGTLRGERGDDAPEVLGRRTPFVARERELATVVNAFEQCAEEPIARVVLVTGAPGVGKSRLRDEVVRVLRAHGSAPAIWSTHAEAMDAGVPFGLVAAVIRNVIGAAASEPPDVRRNKLSTRVESSVASEHVQRVSAFLGELLAPLDRADPCVGTLLKAARGEPGLMRDHIERAFADWLGGECATRPVVLVLDDVHDADPPSLALVDAALDALRSRPLMVLACARPEIDRTHPDLFAQRDVLSLRVGELSRKGSERLVRAVLPGATAAAVERIVERSAGHALFLEELIRATAVGREDLPDTVLAMVQGRLDALDADARRILRAGSVFGETFSAAGVDALVRAPSVASLEELVRREVVRRLPGARDTYAFRHSLVRDAAYAMLTDEDRALGHRLAAEWLATTGEAQAMVLAEHWERGGDRVRAGEAYFRAVEHALSMNDAGAVSLATARGIACGVDGEALGFMRYAESRTAISLGDSAKAEVAALDAMVLCPRGSKIWCAAAEDLAVARGRRGAPDALEEVAAELRSARAATIAFSDTAAIEAWVAAASRVSAALMFVGRYESADEIIEEAQSFVDAQDSFAPLTRALLDQARGHRANHSGDIGRYVALNRSVWTTLRDVEDRRRLGLLGMNFGAALTEAGAYDEAEAVLRESLAAAERGGSPYVVAGVLLNLGRVAGWRGDHETARRLREKAVSAFAGTVDTRFRGGARVLLAETLLALEAIDEAWDLVELALPDLVHNPPSFAYALAVRAQLHLRRGETAEALVATRSGMEIFARLGGMAEGEAVLRRVHAEALAANGHLAEARDTIERACERLLERAATLDEGAARAAFLEGVLDNARTFELARRLRA